MTAGLAEIAAGSIAMGLGGYLAAKSDAEHYAKEREREKREVAEIPHEEMREVAEVFEEYGLTKEETRPIVEALAPPAEEVDRLHDAFRTGPRKTRSKTSDDQRRINRRRVCSWRLHSARAVHGYGISRLWR